MLGKAVTRLAGLKPNHWPGSRRVVHASRGNKRAACVAVVRAAQHQQRETAIDFAAGHSPADDKVAVAPGVIRPVSAAWARRAAELRRP